jgi:long-chain acyl-CoA synthetase
MNVATTLDEGRKAHPDRAAIVFEGASTSYAALADQADRIARGLATLGVARGDRIALWLPNIPAFAAAYFGSLKLGAIAVAVSSGLTPNEARFVLNDSGARALITTASLCGTDPQWLDGLAALEHVLIAEGEPGRHTPLSALGHDSGAGIAAVDLPPDAPAAILYTSGTTGVPKGATLSHANVAFNTSTSVFCCGLRADDRVLLFLPLYHCFGQNAVLNAALHAGATVVLHRGFDPSRVVTSIADDRVTVFMGVPMTFIVLMDRATPAQLSSVRYYFSAAAALPVEVETRWRDRFGLPIHQGYGLTETSPFASYNHPVRHKSGSIGTPVAGVDMRIVDVRDRRPLDAGSVGEIVIRGPNVMLGYWNRPVETAEAVVDAWFHSGDIGRMDAEGYFYIEDRLKDMVIVGGVNVYPAEVENVLYQHAAVAEAAVHAVPDPVMGERVRAVIVRRPGAAIAAAEIVTWCRDRLSAAKVPSEVAFAEALPKNRTGKVLKRVLREEYVPPARAAGAKASGHADLEGRIVAWIAEAVGIDPSQVDLDAPFLDFGLTSVLAVELAAALQEWLGRDVPPTVAWSFSTVRALADHLAASESEARAPRAERLDPAIARLTDEEAERQLEAELRDLGSAAAE